MRCIFASRNSNEAVSVKNKKFMKFSDNIERTSLEEVFVIRTSKEMEAREEYNSNLWDLERENFLKKGNNIYKTVIRDVKIGESIYTKAGKFIAYRSN